MERKNVVDRIAELRAEGETQDFNQIFSALVSEGYDPEHIVMWAGDQLTPS